MNKVKSFITKFRKLLNNNIEGMLYEQNNKLDKVNQNIGNTEYNLNKKIDMLEKKVADLDAELMLFQQLYSKKKKILICGFYGAKNLGDELMLNTLIEKIKTIGEFEISIMLSKNFYTDISKYEGASIIYFPNKTSDFSLIAKKFDCLIFGGGAIIDDENYQSNSEITLGRILVDLSTQFILNNKKTILYGLSTNEKIKDKLFIKNLSYVIENCSYISLRDTNSYDTLQNLGLNCTKIKIVHDIVFCNDYKNNTNKITLNKTKNIRIGFIYICFNDLKNKINKTTKEIIRYYENKNISITLKFIPFYNYNNNDEEFYNSLIKELELKNAIITDFPNNIAELCDILNTCDIIISMRYHGTLISNIIQKNTICINYDSHKHYNNKNKYLFDKYLFNKNIINFSEDINQENISKILTNKNKTIDVSNICDEANKQIIDALSIIKE